MKSLPYSPDAIRLFQEGAIALARVEANGIRVDMEYVQSSLAKLESRIEKKQKNLQSSKVARVWRRAFKTKTNFGATQQLGKVLFDIMKFPSPGRTEGGQHKTDEHSLQGLLMGKERAVDGDVRSFLERYLSIKKLQKSGQFLKQIRDKTCFGMLHPIFSLNTVTSYRSSSEDPNVQNLPVRDEEQMQAVRPAFLAEEGCCIVEVDYSGVEVKVAYCYHKDPTMKRYLIDPSTDMHRDMAMECFGISAKQWAKIPKDQAKRIRYCGKNMFVFPSFYGDYWCGMSSALWEAPDRMNLMVSEDRSLREHLTRKGWEELGDQDPEKGPTKGTFEHHIADVEQRFWKERFAVYHQWKKDHYNEYLDKGWFVSKTGFVYQGYMKRNQVINYPVQGSAFHCLLWSLIEMQKEIEKRGMKAKIIMQIHDSIVANVPKREVKEFLALAKRIMIKRLMRTWDWIITPLEIEAEVAPVGKSWADKEKVEIVA